MDYPGSVHTIFRFAHTFSKKTENSEKLCYNVAAFRRRAAQPHMNAERRKPWKSMFLTKNCPRRSSENSMPSSAVPGAVSIRSPGDRGIQKHTTETRQVSGSANSMTCLVCVLCRNGGVHTFCGACVTVHGDHPIFCVNLQCGASIIHYFRGLHKIWDGLRA